MLYVGTSSASVRTCFGAEVMEEELRDSERRRELRYPVSKETPAERHTIHLVCSRRVDGRTEPILCQPVNLSRHGAQLLVSQAIKIGESVTLRFEGEESGVNLETNATVCWIRDVGQGAFAIGCDLSTEIPAESLSKSISFTQCQVRQSRADGTMDPLDSWESVTLRLSRWGWIGLIAAILWFCLQLSGVS